ncbi:MAG: hypothetical protein IBX69_18605 [Anaerolineales bacterium]|nr:hypothetical protein [Anaerolineales bacterium]
MSITEKEISWTVHNWLKKIKVAYVPGSTNPFMENVVKDLLEQFQKLGHITSSQPDNSTDVILTTANFGEPIKWRTALMFTARKRFGLEKLPTVVTIIQVSPARLKESLEYFQEVLDNDQISPEDYDIPGLAPSAYLTLYEQGKRGGPMLSLMRTLQSQAKCIRIILIVGEETPIEAYTFDLVGAHPRTDATDPEYFLRDLAFRILTAVSTSEITNHQVVGDSISLEQWQRLSTPAAMRKAGLEFGKRNFFTQMIRISDLVHVPAIDEAISRQYSEGCFTTWDPEIPGLIATITGSARPVEKDNLTDDEMAIIIGVRKDGIGALVRNVDGKRNDPPSSEAVEMIEMDFPLPRISVEMQPGNVVANINPPGKSVYEVPVARSKLHGHRGVQSYNPHLIEHVSLDEPYYHYPVSCSTEAQARAIRDAFSRSKAFNDPNDPRQVVFTVLPGHGVVIAEKWVPGKVPFQVIWEFMDSGDLQIENFIPQGPLNYELENDEKMVIKV